MERAEIYKELEMTYDELCHYLIKKYGEATCDYFYTPACKTKSKKVTRTGEGLYCHHWDEDKGGNLSSPASAKLQPFEYQKKERLVYCNILEHLILHIKIDVLRQKGSLKEPYDIYEFFTTGGVFMVCADANGMFFGSGTRMAWRQRCFQEVSDNLEEYILLLQALLQYIDQNYVGERNDNIRFKPGTVLKEKQGKNTVSHEIISVSKTKREFTVRYEEGGERTLPLWIIKQIFTSADYIDIVARWLATTNDTLHDEIYDRIIQYKDNAEAHNIADILTVDYDRYGFYQYDHITLDKEIYGDDNAADYIAKAIPMHCTTAYDWLGKEPVFWEGAEIPSQAKDSFYIVRIEAMFSIKEGEEPFVQCRVLDPNRLLFNLRGNTSPNFKDGYCEILSTSDMYDPKTKQYYSKFSNDFGTFDATATLALGREDFQLFQEKYDIRSMKILDGCYFS